MVTAEQVEQKWLPGPHPAARIYTLENTSLRTGAGFVGHEYIKKSDGYPFSAMLVEATDTKEGVVETYEKTYLSFGMGEFTINGVVYPVNYADLISLPLGTHYSYAAEGTRLFEFNTLPHDPGSSYKPRIITLQEAMTEERTIRRAGFTGHMFITNEEGHPHNAYWVYVGGESPPKQMTGAWRNYFVIDGKGTFTLNGITHEVRQNQLIVIPPWNTYAYEARPLIPMTVFEFNTPPSIPGSYRPVVTK